MPEAGGGVGYIRREGRSMDKPGNVRERLGEGFVLASLYVTIAVIDNRNENIAHLDWVTRICLEVSARTETLVFIMQNRSL